MIPLGLEPGDLVATTKRRLTRDHRLFKGEQLRVVVFGDSRVLSGFKPAQFDSAARQAGLPSVESFNYGLPGESAFLADLDAMVGSGSAPNLVLLTHPWPATGSPVGVRALLSPTNDGEVMLRLFPFRPLATALAALLVTSRFSPHRMREQTRQAEREMRRMLLDRGYYNIVPQIRDFPTHQLPPDIHVPTDTPDSVAVRVVPGGVEYARIRHMLASRGIVALLIPMYYREGNFAAPPPSNKATRLLLEGERDIGVVGPDYLRLPNRMFSDLMHTNPEGAQRYTAEVAALVIAWMRERPASSPAPGTP